MCAIVPEEPWESEAQQTVAEPAEAAPGIPAGSREDDANHEDF
jgi:hypothetical protein